MDISTLVGGWATPLKNMSSSNGMMKFPIRPSRDHPPAEGPGRRSHGTRRCGSALRRSAGSRCRSRNHRGDSQSPSLVDFGGEITRKTDGKNQEKPEKPWENDGKIVISRNMGDLTMGFLVLIQVFFGAYNSNNIRELWFLLGIYLSWMGVINQVVVKSAVKTPQKAHGKWTKQYWRTCWLPKGHYLEIVYFSIFCISGGQS